MTMSKQERNKTEQEMTEGLSRMQDRKEKRKDGFLPIFFWTD